MIQEAGTADTQAAVTLTYKCVHIKASHARQVLQELLGSPASRIKAGQVYVNTYGAGGGVELPFGGYKKSGYGREKGLESLASYTQVKNVCVKFA